MDPNTPGNQPPAPENPAAPAPTPAPTPEAPKPETPPAPAPGSSEDGKPGSPDGSGQPGSPDANAGNQDDKRIRDLQSNWHKAEADRQKAEQDLAQARKELDDLKSGNKTPFDDNPDAFSDPAEAYRAVRNAIREEDRMEREAKQRVAAAAEKVLDAQYRTIAAKDDTVTRDQLEKIADKYGLNDLSAAYKLHKDIEAAKSAGAPTPPAPPVVTDERGKGGPTGLTYEQIRRAGSIQAAVEMYQGK